MTKWNRKHSHQDVTKLKGSLSRNPTYHKVVNHFEASQFVKAFHEVIYYALLPSIIRNTSHQSCMYISGNVLQAWVLLELLFPLCSNFQLLIPYLGTSGVVVDVCVLVHRVLVRLLEFLEKQVLDLLQPKTRVFLSHFR